MSRIRLFMCCYCCCRISSIYTLIPAVLRIFNCIFQCWIRFCVYVFVFHPSDTHSIFGSWNIQSSLCTHNTSTPHIYTLNRYRSICHRHISMATAFLCSSTVCTFLFWLTSQHNINYQPMKPFDESIWFLAAIQKIRMEKMTFCKIKNI